MQDAKTTSVGVFPSLLFLLRVLIGALILTLLLSWVHGFWLRLVVGILVLAIHSLLTDSLAKRKQE